MLDSALAIRAYTANEILPLLQRANSGRISAAERAFLCGDPEFPAASRTASRVHLQGGDAQSDESARSAADWEADIIQRFRNDPNAAEMVGERDTPMGKSLYLARPIRNEPGVRRLPQHPVRGPRTLIARYGSGNGFGWQNQRNSGRPGRFGALCERNRECRQGVPRRHDFVGRAYLPRYSWWSTRCCTSWSCVQCGRSRGLRID